MMTRCIVAIVISIFSVSVWADYDVQLMPQGLGNFTFPEDQVDTLADALTSLHSYGYLASFLKATGSEDGKIITYTIPKDSMDFQGKEVKTFYSDLKDPTYIGNYDTPMGVASGDYDDLCDTLTQTGGWVADDISGGPSDEPDQSWANYTGTFICKAKNIPDQTIQIYKHVQWDCTAPKPDNIITSAGYTLYPTYGLKDNTGVCTWVSGPQGADYASFVGRAIDNNSTPSQSCVMSGDPVDLTNGNVVQQATDLVVKGPFPIVIKRFYNSKHGWQFAYTAYTQSETLGGDCDSGNYGYVFLFEPNGNTFHFTTQSSQGSIDGAKGKYTFSQTQVTYEAPDSVTDTFERPGQQTLCGQGLIAKLATVTNAHGFTQTIGYDSDGNITSISDAFGHKVAIVSHDGKFDSVTDPNGNTIHYTYDKNGNLTQVTWPSGRTVYYQYGDSAHPNLITAVLDGNKKVVSSWTYDSEGQAITNTQEQ